VACAALANSSALAIHSLNIFVREKRHRLYGDVYIEESRRQWLDVNQMEYIKRGAAAKVCQMQLAHALARPRRASKNNRVLVVCAPHLASVIRYLRARANGKGELIFGIATSCVINAVQLTNAV
jgi:hypothetical protein